VRAWFCQFLTWLPRDIFPLGFGTAIQKRYCSEPGRLDQLGFRRHTAIYIASKLTSAYSLDFSSTDRGSNMDTNEFILTALVLSTAKQLRKEAAEDLTVEPPSLEPSSILLLSNSWRGILW
jgi:hypothetical protein